MRDQQCKPWDHAEYDQRYIKERRAYINKNKQETFSSNNEKQKQKSTDDAYKKAMSLKNRGEYDKAIEMLTDIYEERTRTLGDTHLDTLTCQEDLATISRYEEDYEKALEEYTDVYEKFQCSLGHNDYRTVKAGFWVGRILMKLGRNKEAHKHFRHIYPGYESLLGKSHEETEIVLYFMNKCGKTKSRCKLI